ncbi:FG-GAP repeat domain-containing protein, partial [Umezakia ovalisporum]|uniref:FG-GAP repeat domain-containing protein n=1 Tax=Umezakia ovalisporum TaxID=75695 RepID=UPI0039C6786E
ATPISVSAANTPYASTCGDFDNDGRPDVVVGADGSSGDLLIFRNTSMGVGNIQLGTPIAISLLSQAYAMKACDFNGDGFLDLAVSVNGFNEIRIYQNISTGPGNIAFTLANTVNIGLSAFEMEVGDMDGDGLEDIVCSFSFNTVYRILRNTSSGGFISFA